MGKDISGIEEAEYLRLQEAVTRIENAIYFDGGSDVYAESLMLQFVANAKQQMARIELDGEHKAQEKKVEAERQAAINIEIMVERETALTASEKQEYAALLNEDHFKKADFGRIEHFYAHSWDKLTEAGKDQMSYRVWEGIRQHEYKFDQLPEVAKEKEAQRVELGLTGAQGARGELGAIPEKDRTEFLDARTNGRHQQSYEILDRPVFAEHVAVSPAGNMGKSTAAIAELVCETAARKSGEPAPEQVAVRDLMNSKKLTLQGIEDIDAQAANIQPPLPELAAGVAKMRQ